ncbi:MAG TPA: O-antigen ligase family protein, partial [Candidatus Saccharimonadales bacterium]|nr:O-antigen ligase family protein [Candidatus Saccharimonadales bacterium]
MKQLTAGNRVAQRASWLAAIILALVPFHAFITVWPASVLGHYTLLRLWKEYLLVIVAAGAVHVLITDRALRKKLFSLRITQLIAAYCLVIGVWSLIPLARGNVTGKAIGYGFLVDLRFLVFFLSVTVLAAKSNVWERNWLKLLLIPATLVAAFAVLQYLVLPYDFLRHFGYGPNTIMPYETINNSVQHIRVESTLRGANPLGAYLLVPVSLMMVMFFRQKGQRFNKIVLSFGLLLALLFSFSRSAWIGVGLAGLTVGWLSLKSGRSRKLAAWGLVALIVLGGVVAINLRNNTSFESVVLHTQHGSKALRSSNQNHVSAFKMASKDVIHQPWGRGVGTAGPQSVYNNGRSRIAENYFLQIGQEAGILGLALFIAICIYLGKLLYEQRAAPLALALLAALIGLT